MLKEVPEEPESPSLVESDPDVPIRSCSLKIFYLVYLETSLCIDSIHFVGLVNGIKRKLHDFSHDTHCYIQLCKSYKMRCLQVLQHIASNTYQKQL